MQLTSNVYHILPYQKAELKNVDISLYWNLLRIILLGSFSSISTFY